MSIAVLPIRNNAYACAAWGYIGYVDQHAHPEHEGMQRTYTFNDVLLDGPGEDTGIAQYLFGVDAGGMGSIMSADGALTNLTLKDFTVRNWVASSSPDIYLSSSLDRPMTLNVDALVIENVRGAVGGDGAGLSNAINFGSGFGDTSIVHLSVEQSGCHWEDTIGYGTVVGAGGGVSVMTPGESDFRFILSTFIGNRAAVGAAIYMNDPLGDLSLDRCSFVENVAFKKGGAIYFEGAREMRIDSSWFFDNAVRPAASSSVLNYALTIFTGGNVGAAPIVSCNCSCLKYAI